MDQIFILSPARTVGKRAAMAMNPTAQFDLARRLRSAAGAPLGEVFSFLSGLYFRGKLAYARRFSKPPTRSHGGYVITANAGLMPVDAIINIATLQSFSQTAIDLAEPRYVGPLRESTATIAKRLGGTCQVVPLGSIATGKYVDILKEQFGERLAFPTDFIGRGDMSRGGLMLRAAAVGKN